MPDIDALVLALRDALRIGADVFGAGGTSITCCHSRLPPLLSLPDLPRGAPYAKLPEGPVCDLCLNDAPFVETAEASNDDADVDFAVVVFRRENTCFIAGACPRGDRVKLGDPRGEFNPLLAFGESLRDPLGDPCGDRSSCCTRGECGGGGAGRAGCDVFAIDCGRGTGLPSSSTSKSILIDRNEAAEAEFLLAWAIAASAARAASTKVTRDGSTISPAISSVHLK